MAKTSSMRAQPGTRSALFLQGGGVCSTCKARLLEGEVDMDITHGLEPGEIEQGFILTCQAHPISDKVVVDFDQK